MASVNKAIILGRLGADPELKYTQSNAAVCNLSIATNEKWKDKNGEVQDRTEWHRVTLWNKAAENAAKYLAKGREVYIEGRIQTRSWEDKDGNKRYATEIVGDRMQFIGGKGEGGSQGGSRSSQQDGGSSWGNDQDAPPISDDDIPF